MLHDFIAEHRTEIIARCRAKIASRPAPRPTDEELEYGVPLFLDQIAETLRSKLNPSASMAKSATAHGGELSRRGFTVAQVVHDYGGVCQTITELAVEKEAPITASEFKIFNLCLDEAIAESVTEYVRLREYEGKERLGHLAHELGNLLNGAFLAYDVLKTGSVGIGGSTGSLLGSSLTGMRNVIGRELAEVRLGSGIQHRETIVVFDFIEDLEVAATIEAKSRALEFSVVTVGREVTVAADRQILASVVTNLLQNAFKFTRPKGHIVLRARATADRVFIEVEDQCGGLPPGRAEELFTPYEQRSEDRSGVGLGLSICERGARANGGEVHARNKPGVGCVFTVDLPRQLPATHA
jgi:signal transduction histidine kinase